MSVNIIHTLHLKSMKTQNIYKYIYLCVWICNYKFAFCHIIGSHYFRVHIKNLR